MLFEKGSLGQALTRAVATAAGLDRGVVEGDHGMQGSTGCQEG